MRTKEGLAAARKAVAGRPVANVAWASATVSAKRTEQSCGGVLSSEIFKIAEAEAPIIVEGNMCGVAMRDVDAPPES